MAETPEWVAMQTKTFTRWANSFLKRKGLKIESLFEDLSDGINLVRLLEVIGAEDVVALSGRGFNKKPRIRLQKLENVNMALKYIESKEIKLVNIGSNDIVDGNVKITLGLLWTLILRFAVAELDGKKGLLLWCQKNTKNHDGVNVTNFTNSWTNGLGFCALINRFRPDLIDYDALDKSDAAGNMEKAFAAAEGLGIDRLLDVEDLVGNVAPDEKSIISYLSLYYRYFSAGQANEKFVKTLLDALNISRRHKAWEEQYEFDAAALLAWIAEQTAKYSSATVPNETSAISDDIASLATYMRDVKPEKKGILLRLEGLLGQLRSSSRANGRKEYVPPEGQDMATIEAAWNKLEEVESAHRNALLAAYEKFLVMDYASRRFAVKAARVNAWATENNNVFAAGVTGNTIAELETAVDANKVYSSQLEAYTAEIGELEGFAGQVESEHPSHEEVSNSLASTKAQLTATTEAGTVYKAELLLALEAAKNLAALENNYLLKAEELDFKIDALEEEISAPVLEGSANAIQEMQNSLSGSFTEALTASSAVVAELQTMEAQLTEAGKTVVRPSAGFQERLDILHSKLNARQSGLVMKLGVVSNNENLTKDFATVAEALSTYCTQANDNIASISGEPEAQLEALAGFATAHAEAATQLTAVEEAWNAMESAGVVICKTTDETVYSLQAAYGAVGDVLESRQAQLTAAISSADADAAATAELQKEMREVFNFFDTDGSKTLNSKEFNDACQGIGLPVEEKDVEAYFASNAADGGLSFEKFVEFVGANTVAGAGPDDVENAFRTLTKSETITEEQVKQLFAEDPEVTEYVLSSMPKNEDGTFDYKSYIASTFTPKE